MPERRIEEVETDGGTSPAWPGAGPPCPASAPALNGPSRQARPRLRPRRRRCRRGEFVAKSDQRNRSGRQTPREGEEHARTWMARALWREIPVPSVAAPPTAAATATVATAATQPRPAATRPRTTISHGSGAGVAETHVSGSRSVRFRAFRSNSRLSARKRRIPPALSCVVVNRRALSCVVVASTGAFVPFGHVESRGVRRRVLVPGARPPRRGPRKAAEPTIAIARHADSPAPAAPNPVRPLPLQNRTPKPGPSPPSLQNRLPQPTRTAPRDIRQASPPSCGPDARRHLPSSRRGPRRRTP